MAFLNIHHDPELLIRQLQDVVCEKFNLVARNNIFVVRFCHQDAPRSVTTPGFQLLMKIRNLAVGSSGPEVTWVNTSDIHADLLMDLAALASEQDKPISHVGMSWLICRTEEEGEACARLLEKVLSWRVGRGGLYLEGGVGRAGWAGVAAALPRLAWLVCQPVMVGYVYFVLDVLFC